MFLNGHEVRHRAAELAPAAVEPTDGKRNASPHFEWLEKMSGIPVGTLHNATRDNSPQGVSLTRVYDLAKCLRRPGEELPAVVSAILAGGEEGKPEPKPEPKPERQRDPSSPPPRKNGKDDQRGPKRTADMRAAS